MLYIYLLIHILMRSYLDQIRERNRERWFVVKREFYGRRRNYTVLWSRFNGKLEFCVSVCAFVVVVMHKSVAMKIEIE